MNRPLRILMVCPQFRPLIGGYERAAERLAKGLATRGQVVDVLTERRDRAWPAREEVDGITIHRVASIARPRLHGPSAAVSFLGFLGRYGDRYDVIHVHQYGLLAGAAIGYARCRGIPSCLKITNTGADGIEAVLMRTRAGTLLRPMHRQVSACITTSERAGAEAREFGIPTERIHRIPNPLDTTRFHPPAPETRRAARSELRIGNEFLAVSVSRLSAEKNHAMLIDAWERVATHRDDVRLAVLGTGPLESEIQRRIKDSPARERICLVGPVDDPRMWYSAADLFVLPSLHEGLSNSLMEAMSCGLPSVCTRVSGVEDIFAEAAVGHMVEPGDAPAFANAIAKVIAAPDVRARFARTARGYATEHFAVDRVVEQTLDLYSTVAASARSNV